MTVATSQETVKLSLKVDAVTAQANGLQDTWLTWLAATHRHECLICYGKKYERVHFTNQLPW